MVPLQRCRPCGVFLACVIAPSDAPRHHMTLRSRLAAGLVTIAIILVGPLVFAIQSLHRLHDDAVQLRDHDFAASLAPRPPSRRPQRTRHEELALLFAQECRLARLDGARSRARRRARRFALRTFSCQTTRRPLAPSVRQLADAAPREYDAALGAIDTTYADSLSAHVFVPALNTRGLDGRSRRDTSCQTRTDARRRRRRRDRTNHRRCPRVALVLCSSRSPA